MTYVARRAGPSTAVAELGSMSTSLRERPPPRPLAPRLPREGRRRSLTRRLSERPRRPDSLDPEAKDRVRQRPEQGQRPGQGQTGTDGDRREETRTEIGRDQDRDRETRTGTDRDRQGQSRTGRDQDRNQTCNRREQRVRRSSGI